MGMAETAETWIRIDLFCDGLGDDGTCVRGTNGDLDRISDVAPTAEGARKAILNAAVKSPWRFDPKLDRWLCPECVAVCDADKDLASASGYAREAGSIAPIDAPPTAPLDPLAACPK
jgi:hypothetical protein